MTRTLQFVAVLCLAIGFAAGTLAQPPAPAPAPAATTMTIERLGDLLKQLGCAPEPIRDPDDKLIGYRGTFRSKKGWGTLGFRALPTADGFTVWFKAPLAQVTDMRGAPVEMLFKLLAANGEIGPAFFAYDDEESRLYLYTSAYAAGLSPDGLEAQFEFLCEKVAKTRRIWDTKYWPADQVPATRPAAEALPGPPRSP
jgi:hypothetical protein